MKKLLFVLLMVLSGQVMAEFASSSTGTNANVNTHTITSIEVPVGLSNVYILHNLGRIVLVNAYSSNLSVAIWLGSRTVNELFVNTYNFSPTPQVTDITFDYR